MIKLRNASLGSLRGPALPRYDRSALSSGILHLGLGNFHRAHQAVYLDDLLNNGGNREWAVTAAVSRAEQLPLMRDALSQDGLYTLRTLSPSGRVSDRVIGSIADAIDGVGSPSSLVDRIAEASVKIVMFTVTEGGYYLRPDGEKLLADHSEILEDLGGSFRTIYSFLRSGLKKRMNSHATPLTLLSCDNLRGNGDALRNGLLNFLELAGEDRLAAWIEKNLTFPNSMVDRITPKSDPKLSAELEQTHGYADAAALSAEDYIQWALEDDFAAGRPPFENAGVEIVSNIYEKEESKIRILNGGHCAVAWFAALDRHTEFHQAMEDERLSRFLNAYVEEEVLPTLDFVDFDLSGYFETIKERFRSPHVPDTVERLAAEGASRLPKFVVPVVLDLLARKQRCRRGFEILAAWFEALRRDRQGRLHFVHREQDSERVNRWMNAPNPFETFIGDCGFWDYGTEYGETFKEGMRAAQHRLEQNDFAPPAHD